jgi:hypothetical protein
MGIPGTAPGGMPALTRMTRLIDKCQRVPRSPLSRINLSFAERLAAACLIASVSLPAPSELFYTDAGK